MLTNVMHKINGVIDKIYMTAAGILFIVLIISSTLQVFTRYFLNSSLVGTEELARYCFVWMSLLGGSIAVGRWAHTSISVIYDRLPPVPQKCMRIVHNILVLVLCYIFIKGGFTMMKTAVQALHDEAEKHGVTRPKLIAVTILTSLNQSEWYGALKISEQVTEFAKLAKDAGLDGVVASPQEAKLIRETCGENFLIVTPGVRPAGANVDDQSRIATPKSALANGATHLVIGRPIRAAQNPREAALKILDEMRGV